jgi:hypothetical protein
VILRSPRFTQTAARLDGIFVTHDHGTMDEARREHRLPPGRRPEIAIPIHQAGLADVHQQMHYQVFRSLAPSGTAIYVLDTGAAMAL